MDFAAFAGGCPCFSDRDLVANESGEHLDLLSDSESDVSFDDKANTLNCDYSQVTPLFRAIELEDWKGILLFLTTGRWSNSPLASSYTHLQEPTPERQARTWITCKGKNGETQWRQLPIHAAISYTAPLPVVQKLLELHHDGIRSPDDTGNLPLHLAFGFGANDGVVAHLIRAYPHALSVKGLQNRRPLDCCDLGPNRARGDTIQACQAYTRKSLIRDWDQHWKKSLLDAQKKAGLTEPLSAKCVTLEDVFNELMQVKIELRKTKELAKNRPTMIITRTEPLLQPIEPSRHLISVAPSSSSRFGIRKKGSMRSLRGDNLRRKSKNLLRGLRPTPSGLKSTPSTQVATSIDS